MENLLVCIVLYVAIVAVAYRPKAKATATPSAEEPINYFPEVEEVEEEEEAIAVEPVEVAEEVTPEPIKTPSVVIPANLENLTIRQLKKLASAAKIRRYSSLTKAQLIDRLAAPEVAAIARKAA
jgi:cbb3-type cytochrome oxidase subunit 3